MPSPDGGPGRPHTASGLTAGALRNLQARYRELIERIPAVTYVDAADEVSSALFVSPQVEAMLGYPPEEWLADRELFVKLLHPEDHERVLAENARTNQTGDPFTAEYRLVARDGRVVWVRDEATLVRDEETGAPLFWQGIITDVTERKALEERLRHRALHDPLTDLPNRELFVDRLAQALARTERSGDKVAVMFADLDNFKHVNDSLGHEAGDRLLVEVSGRLQRCVRPGDTVARFGGDEFALLLEDVAGEITTTEAAGRISHRLERPFVLEGHEVFVTASVGIALATASDGETPEALLKQADTAMYRAKEAGKDHHEVFRPGMANLSSRRLELDRGLRRALEREEFSLHYQPQVTLSGGALSGGVLAGVEALLRWDRPGHGVLPPGEFIPLAEETGLIVPMGRWVIREACRQAAEWLRMYPDELPPALSVNISARQFRDAGLVQDVARALEETALPPDRLILEITESVAMEDAYFTTSTLQKLKGLGVQLAIDDFGTGYSSLSYLRRFAVDYLKIDRSFVEGLHRNHGDAVVASGVVSLAHAMGLKVVAEGVETGGQLAKLERMGCDIAQGFLFAGPLPSENAAELLAGGPRWP